MDRFLWGGWVARPSAFYFCTVALVALSYSVLLGRPLFFALLGSVALFQLVALFA